MSNERKGGARLDKAVQKQKNAAPQKRPAPQRPPQPQGRPAGGKPPQGNGKKPPQPQKTGMRRGVKALIITVAVLAAILLALIVWYKFFWAVLPDVGNKGENLGNNDLPPIPAASKAPSQNIDSDETPAPVSDRKEGFYTFLLVGRDTGGGGNTDTMMLVSYDIPNQKVAIMSLPRDTMVDARHPGENKKLNAVFNLGRYYAPSDQKRPGIEYLEEACGDMMGFAPDFYVYINWEAFGRLVDAIGGVDFDVPFNMNYDDPKQDLHIHQSAGYRHLTGKDAMQVIRWRKNTDAEGNVYGGYSNGDLGRIQTQQALMKAIIKECLQFKNVTKITEFAEIFEDEVETDLTLGNLVAFAERAILGGLTMEDVEMMTMPNDGVYVGKSSYVQARPEELRDILNRYFNPYTDDILLEEMDIMQYSDSRGFYTTRGDGKPRY